MLDYFMRENLWEPEALESTAIREYIEQIHKLNSNKKEYLYIFKTVPYMDAIYVRFNEEGDVNSETSAEKNTVAVVADNVGKTVEKGAEKTVCFYQRFAFHEGYRWTDEEERIFVQRCLRNPECGYNYEALDNAFKYYAKAFPDWKLKRYHTEPMKMLEHIYHCMVKGTAKEMLYKAGLDSLAGVVDKLEDMDLLAGKPSDLFCGVPIKVLRSLNCKEGARILISPEKCAFIKEIHKKFQDTFKSTLNDAQCRYLNFLIDGELTVGEAGRLFRSRRADLRRLWNDAQYQMFMWEEAREKRTRDEINIFSEIDPIYKTYLLNMSSNASGDDMRLQSLKFYLLNRREEYDAKIRRSNRKRDYDWQERTNGYVVRYPQTINDFCREAIYMSNCLITYVEAYVNNDTDILFVRKPADFNTPFITMEIYGNELMQAYHRFNNDCTATEAEWIRDYCERHGIGTSKFKFDCTQDELF